LRKKETTDGRGGNLNLIEFGTGSKGEVGWTGIEARSEPARGPKQVIGRTTYAHGKRRGWRKKGDFGKDLRANRRKLHFHRT